MRNTEWPPKKTQEKGECQKKFLEPPKVGGKGEARAQVGEGRTKSGGRMSRLPQFEVNLATRERVPDSQRKREDSHGKESGHGSRREGKAAVLGEGKPA